MKGIVVACCLAVLAGCNVKDVTIVQPTRLDDGSVLPETDISYYIVCIVEGYRCSTKQTVRAGTTILNVSKGYENIRAKTVLFDGRHSEWSNAISAAGVDVVRLKLKGSIDET